MAFLSSKKRNPSLSPESRLVKPQVLKSRSILSADLQISGEVRSKGEVELNGTIEGTMDSRSLIVGEHAEVRGTIVADSLEVHGTLDGLVRAKTVSLHKTANVSGEILHHSLAIEPGAFIAAEARRLATETARPNILESLSSQGTNECLSSGANQDESAGKLVAAL